MATPLWVRCSTSRVSAIWVSHVPIWEISCPTKNSRKFLTDSDRNVVRTAVVIRPLTITSYRERFVSLTKWTSRGVGDPDGCPRRAGSRGMLDHSNYFAWCSPFRCESGRFRELVHNEKDGAIIFLDTHLRAVGQLGRSVRSRAFARP